MRRTVAGLLFVVAVVLTVGCSSGSKTGEPASTSSPATSPTGTEALDGAALQTAAQLNAELIIAGDAEQAYAVLSARCQAQETPAAYAERLTAAATQEKSTAGIDISTLHVASVSVSNVSSTTGQAMVSLATADGAPSLATAPAPWVVEDGEWRFDNCPGSTTTTT